MDARRSTKEIIDQAIEENRISEYMLYCFATTFVFVGVFVLLVGVIQKSGLTSVAGCIASGLFFPAMSASRAIRQANISIRLLEVPLSQASTSDEAAKILNKFFVASLVQDKGTANDNDSGSNQTLVPASEGVR